MLEFFNNPPAEYRVTPFWFWNASLDTGEIERQIREMHDKGVGGFFIHGRFGLRTEYMGTQWMECVRHACEIARTLGMHVYLYDENPFPSGVAGGTAMRDDKHFNKYLDIVRHSAKPGEQVELAIPEGDVLSASAVNQQDRSHRVDLLEHITDGKLIWTAPDAPFDVFVFTAAKARYAGFIYGSEPDYFEQSLVDQFFSFTHERYAAELEPYFGNVIKGIFTDEPKIQCIHHMHHDAYTTAWFSDLPEQFRADHGYDIIPNLVCLATDAGPSTGKVRRDFWNTVTSRYIERFFHRYHRWCEQHNLKLTGHLFLEEGLYANTMYQGNFPQVLSTFDVPGVDHLALVAEGEYSIRTIPRSITRTHGQKLGSSVAHTAGRPRVLSETYGCAGWGLSMAHMKWIFNWQASLGINFLCPHAFYYSLAGVRKTDAPPSQFYQATYWPHYRLFADYAARICYALSQGKHKAQVALLYPISGFHSEWAPGMQGPIDRIIAECFDTYCAYLVREHLDYDIVTEEAVSSAAAVDQQLIIGEERYDLLIIPPTTAISYGAAEKICEFTSGGGKLIGTMLLPTQDAEGSRHQDVCRIFESLFHRSPDDLRSAAASGEHSAEVNVSRPSENIFFVKSGGADALPDILRETVSQAIRPEVSVKLNGSECRDINVLHRVLDGGDLFFFANNAGEPREVQLSIRCAGAPYQLDPETGQSSALPNCTQVGGRTVLLHRFEPYGCLLVCFGTEPALSLPPSLPEDGEDVPLGDRWHFKAEGPNAFPLSDWSFSITTLQDRMQYDYTTSFNLECDAPDIQLLLDEMPEIGTDAGCAGSNCSVFVNDQPVLARGAWTLDVGFQTLDISQSVRRGQNTVRISIEHGGWSGDPQLMVAEARLLGRFSVHLNSDSLLPAPTELSVGSWTDQGYPYFSGTGAYTQTFELPELRQGQRVIADCGRPRDMVEFVVNGACAGVRAWAPYAADITRFVKPGTNEITLRVTNSLENLLLSNPKASGLMEQPHIYLA